MATSRVENQGGASTHSITTDQCIILYILFFQGSRVNGGIVYDYLMLKGFLGCFLILVVVAKGEQSISDLKLVVKNPKTEVESEETVISNGELDSDFSDKIYSQTFCCETQLYILDLKAEYNQHVLLRYNATQQPTQSNITIQASPEGAPCPTVQQITGDSILLATNCPLEPSDSNYWSKVDITIYSEKFRFSFRIQCDFGGRHNNFEWGYVIIMVINSIIMTGVALHSRIWSIRLNKSKKALGIPVRWIWLTIFTILAIVVGGLLIYRDSTVKNSNLFGGMIMIVGDVVATILGVIILDEMFFLVDAFRKKVWKFFRICDILSIVVSMLITSLFGIVPSIAKNYPFNDVLSVIISVGSIKLFKFLNLRDAIMCCFIVFAFENVTALALHFIYQDMSYNDLFGANVSSPLVMQISILSYSLYQKCSWLPVTEIILPGITIAYLRRYDYSRDSKLYFIFGNALFVVSTFLWILIQSLTVHSLPFALITYPALFIPIMVLAYKRDELSILMNGKFYDPEFMDSSQVKPIEVPGLEQSQIQENTLEGLIPESDDLENSGRSDTSK